MNQKLFDQFIDLLKGEESETENWILVYKLGLTELVENHAEALKKIIELTGKPFYRDEQ